MLRLIVFTCLTLVSSQSKDPDRWWKSANIYQISTVSFKDSNNDGFGDIQGIISKLDFLAQTGIDVIFLTPFYKTPFKDFAYDIASYKEIDSRFGTLADAEELLSKAKAKGLKVILDFVPNHSSNEHEWFINSENRVKGFEKFYVWHDGIPTANGSRPLPPNGWQSVYGGSSWEWSEKRQAFYYHAFAKEQPDLNLREQRVINELNEVLIFWLEKGADGFRVDAVSQLYEDAAFIEDPEIANNLPQTYELVGKWRQLVDNYTAMNGGDSRILVPQVWESKLEYLAKYIQNEKGEQLAQLPTNFILINELMNSFSRASALSETIDKYLSALPKGAIPNWFLGTHDHSRVASRMGAERLDGLMLLLLTLPGVAFMYNGDEIGMTDYRDITWDDTTDPWACNSNPIDFKALSRDPSRTPFQWDGSLNAGFNGGGKPWIPINTNYTEINLELEMKAESSHYKFYKELLRLRKTEAFVNGDFESKPMTHNIFGFSRSFDGETFVILINLGGTNMSVNVNDLTAKLEDESEIVLASPSSFHKVGDVLNTSRILMGPFDAVILKSNATRTSLSLAAFVVLIIKLFL